MKFTDIILENDDAKAKKIARAKTILKAFKKGEFKIKTTSGNMILKYEITSEPDYIYANDYIEIDFPTSYDNNHPVHLDIKYEDKTKTPPNLDNYGTYLNYLSIFNSRLEKKLVNFDIYVSC